MQVAMVDVGGTMTFAPNEFRFARGTNVRFTIRNDTERPHEFVLGSHTENLAHSQTMTLGIGQGHDEPNGRVVAAGATVNLDWQFTKVGEFEFGCLLAGHPDVEIAGRIVVE
ncbi:copper resistance protein [Rhodopseudomonas boonkerdii]|uniref:cupredoxin domain-containing protein n=1 Tax=Rhodopseudomonas boonkerdii TaxID=475937 RepID=UPI001E313E1A|nr:plastocyanin/azurin family copper-binding protein [Rhodopseudomonas boonkerdii]UGV26952.1 copper resistance protein [Rhodopseudomonas boonkerdii]